MKNFNKKRGISILGVLALGVVLIFVLSYFNISIKSIVNSPSSQENINYVRGEVKSFWGTYLAEPVSRFYNDVVVNIFWKGFISNMERIRDSQFIDFNKAADNLQI
ncbi:MAG: hypothetical protein WCW93_02865 [Candidatus Paceibacterota bacterium]